jgi:hypothetical protein
VLGPRVYGNDAPVKFVKIHFRLDSRSATTCHSSHSRQCDAELPVTSRSPLFRPDIRRRGRKGDSSLVMAVVAQMKEISEVTFSIVNMSDILRLAPTVGSKQM